MIQIIPAILEKEFSAIAQKIRRVEKEAPDIGLVQIDIADGVFVPNITGSRAEDLAEFSSSLTYEIHLMTQNPLRILDEWFALSRLKRIIIHKEACSRKDVSECAMRAHKAGKELAVALNPSTPVSAIIDELPQIDMVLLMGVDPGFAGQLFKEGVLSKIHELRAKAPAIPISVDGGINLETAPRIILAGATHLCLGSYLWKQENIGKAIRELQFL